MSTFSWQTNGSHSYWEIVISYSWLTGIIFSYTRPLHASLFLEPILVMVVVVKSKSLLPITTPNKSKKKEKKNPETYYELKVDESRKALHQSWVNHLLFCFTPLKKWPCHTLPLPSSNVEAPLLLLLLVSFHFQGSNYDCPYTPPFQSKLYA